MPNSQEQSRQTSCRSVVIVVLVQILVNVVIACLPCQVDHDPSRWLPSLGQAKTTVAYLPARWTYPAVVAQWLTEVLSVAIDQTWTTELSAHASAVLVPTDCLGVDGFLSALVARGAPHAIIYLVRASFNGVYGATVVGDGAVNFNR
jgi:hypothetical protein